MAISENKEQGHQNAYLEERLRQINEERMWILFDFEIVPEVVSMELLSSYLNIDAIAGLRQLLIDYPAITEVIAGMFGEDFQELEAIEDIDDFPEISALIGWEQQEASRFSNEVVRSCEGRVDIANLYYLQNKLMALKSLFLALHAFGGNITQELFWDRFIISCFIQYFSHGVSSGFPSALRYFENTEVMYQAQDIHRKRILQSRSELLDIFMGTLRVDPTDQGDDARAIVSSSLIGFLREDKDPEHLVKRKTIQKRLILQMNLLLSIFPGRLDELFRILLLNGSSELLTQIATSKNAMHFLKFIRQS